MTSKLRLLLLLSAAYHSKIQLRMFILQANYKSQLPNLTSQANCQLPTAQSHFTSQMHCPKTQAKFSSVTSLS